jgi:hypothetical protein
MDEASRQALAKLRRPGIFADAATMGLQRPVAGAVKALDFWNNPGTSVSERFHSGMDDYTKDLNAQIADTHPLSALAQSTAGSMVMGGPSGSLWKQGAFDAGTAATQGLASGDSWSDILASALMNAGMGGVFNAGGAGVGKVRDLNQAYEEMLQNTGRR